jgi:PST family polysaccharide transporter
LATNVVLARRVSASGFGVTGIAQSATQYFGLLSELGLGTVAVREGAQHPDKLQGVISSMLGLRLMLVLVAVPLGLLTAQFLPYSEASRNLFRIFLLTLPLQAISVEWVFRSVQKMYLNTALQIVGALSTFALTVALVRGSKDLIRIAVISAIVSAVTVVLGIQLLRREGYHAWPAFSIRESRYYLGQSLPLCASFFAITLYTQANYLILGAVRGDADVGLYGAATKLSAVFYFPIWLYFEAIAPALMEAWVISPENARSLLSTSVRITATVGIGSGLVGASAGQWLITLVFGKTFNGSGGAFEFLIWTGVVIAIGYNWGQLCVASKRSRLLMQSSFLGAVVNLTVCAATVSHMGVRGAALSNLVAEIAVSTLLVTSLGWHMGPSVLRAATKPVIAGTCAYAVSFATRSSGSAACSILTALSYLALLFLIGGFTKHDLNRLRALIPIRRSGAGFPS